MMVGDLAEKIWLIAKKRRQRSTFSRQQLGPYHPDTFWHSKLKKYQARGNPVNIGHCRRFSGNGPGRTMAISAVKINRNVKRRTFALRTRYWPFTCWRNAAKLVMAYVPKTLRPRRCS